MLQVTEGQAVAIRYLHNRPRLGFVIWELTDNSIIVDSIHGTERLHFDETGAGIEKSRRWQLLLDVQAAALEIGRFDLFQEAVAAVRNVRVQISSAENSIENLKAAVETLETKFQKAKGLVAAFRSAERRRDSGTVGNHV